jgi:hypothetical protein
MKDTGEGSITSQLDEHASGTSISGSIEGVFRRLCSAQLDSLSQSELDEVERLGDARVGRFVHGE